MGKLVVHQDKITDIKALMAICPFGAMTEKNGTIEISAACRLCKLCVKKGNGAMEFVEDEPKEQIDKSKWQGIAVYIDHVEGHIHPVSFELLGKARELADKIHQQVYALFMGQDMNCVTMARIRFLSAIRKVWAVLILNPIPRCLNISSSR